MSISAASPEWKKYLRVKIDEYKQWYLTEMIPLKLEKVRERASMLLLTHIERFHNALDDTVEVDSAIHTDWYNKLDKVRNTDFVKTFPELSWNLKSN